MTIKPYLGWLLIISSIGSCTSYRLSQRNPRVCDAEQTNAKTIILESQTTWRTNNTHYQGRLSLHIQRDSLIGFSLTHGMGFEVLRGQVTPTSITWINRLEKTYQQYDYPMLWQHIPMRCNYAILQAILLNEWNEIIERNELPNWDINLAANGGIPPYLISCKKEPTQVVQLVDKETQQRCWVVYTYKKANGITGITVYLETMHWQVRYKKKRFFRDVVSFPFKIPHRYDKL